MFLDGLLLLFLLLVVLFYLFSSCSFRSSCMVAWLVIVVPFSSTFVGNSRPRILDVRQCCFACYLSTDTISLLVALWFCLVCRGVYVSFTFSHLLDLSVVSSVILVEYWSSDSFLRFPFALTSRFFLYLFVCSVLAQPSWLCSFCIDLSFDCRCSIFSIDFRFAIAYLHRNGWSWLYR